MRSKKYLSSTKAYKNNKISKGICVNCLELSRPGKTLCQKCADKQIEKEKIKKKQLEGKGLCVACGKYPNVQGIKICEMCRKKRLQYSSNYRTLTKATGICPRCGEPAIQGKIHCQDCLDKTAAHVREINAEIRAKTFSAYGGKCVCCGMDYLPVLVIDHKNGNGNKHRKEVTSGKAGVNFYRWLIKNNFPQEFQILCQNCNWVKGTYGKCTIPHNLGEN